MSGPAVNIFGWMRAVQSDADLTLADRLIASHLALYVNRQTGECFPSMQTLAEGVNVAVRSVQRAMGALEAGGWLTRERTNRRTSYTYRLSTKGAPIRPEVEEDASPGPDTDVRSNNVGPDMGVASKKARPDTGVAFDRTPVSANLTSDPKKPPSPLRRASINGGKGHSGRVPIALDDPRWAACAAAWRRQRCGQPGPPVHMIEVNGRRCEGWTFDASIVDLPAIPPGYRYPYAEAAE